VIACGFAYSGTNTKCDNNKDQWNKGKVINITNLQLVYLPSEFFRHWNISVHHFLKRYVYMRICDNNKDFIQKSIAQSKTFFISAFWHGFHPTYFVVFLNFYIFILIESQTNHVLKILQINL